MPHFSLGVVTVAKAGDLVPVTKNQAEPVTRVPCQSILIQALSNDDHVNTGRIYVFDGTKRRLATLAIPAAHTIPSFSATLQALNASDYFIGADIAGDGADVSILRL